MELSQGINLLNREKKHADMKSQAAKSELLNLRGDFVKLKDKMESEANKTANFKVIHTIHMLFAPQRSSKKRLLAAEQSFRKLYVNILHRN